MAGFPGIKLTDAGKAALAESIATGKAFVITRVALGDGFLLPGENRESMTDLVNHLRDAPIVSRRYTPDGTVMINARLTSAEIAEELLFREIGVFAHIDGKPDVLYMYDNAGDAPDTIPVGGGGTFVDQIFRLTVVIGEAANVVIQIDPNADLDLEFHYVVDRYIASENQQTFFLVNTNASGALTVIIDGAEAEPIEAWTPSPGAVQLTNPLPAGARVWIRELKPVLTP